MDPDLHRAGKTQEPRKRMWMPQLQDPLRASDQQNGPETKTGGKPLVFLDEQASLPGSLVILLQSCPGAVTSSVKSTRSTSISLSSLEAGQPQGPLSSLTGQPLDLIFLPNRLGPLSAKGPVPLERELILTPKHEC